MFYEIYTFIQCASLSDFDLKTKYVIKLEIYFDMLIIIIVLGSKFWNTVKIIDMCFAGEVILVILIFRE